MAVGYKHRQQVRLEQILQNLPLPVVGGAARILAPSHMRFLLYKTLIYLSSETYCSTGVKNSQL